MCLYSVNYFYVSLNCLNSRVVGYWKFFSEIRITSTIYEIYKSYILEHLLIWIYHLEITPTANRSCLTEKPWWLPSEDGMEPVVEGFVP